MASSPRALIPPNSSGPAPIVGASSATVEDGRERLVRNRLRWLEGNWDGKIPPFKPPSPTAGNGKDALVSGEEHGYSEPFARGVKSTNTRHARARERVGTAFAPHALYQRSMPALTMLTTTENRSDLTVCTIVRPGVMRCTHTYVRSRPYHL